MIFAFLPPYIACLIWDKCRKILFFKFVASDVKHGCVFKHILKTNIYELLQNNHK